MFVIRLFTECPKSLSHCLSYGWFIKKEVNIVTNKPMKLILVTIGIHMSIIHL